MNIQDIIVILALVAMEGFLSFDNAIVLAAMVRHLPQNLRKKALTYGIAGAFGFRILAVSLVSYLMKSVWIKFVGGIYLLYLAYRFFSSTEEEEDERDSTGAAFWRTILMVELADIAFSTDSILASVGMSSKVWVVITGGILGIIMMRFAATIFIKLMDVFPNLERTAYFLISIIGAKLILEGFRIEGVDFHSSSNPAFWIFWGLFAGSLASGFFKEKNPFSIVKENHN